MLRSPFRRAGLSVLTGALAAAIVTLGAAPAQAHPLGNFTVNHYDGLTLRRGQVVDSAVVDRAEIPTMQARATIDTNHDGVLEADELAAAAVIQCAQLATSAVLRIDGTASHWRVISSSLALTPGAAGLPTSRLSCELTAAADLTRPATLTFADDADDGHVGWREITAAYDGVHTDGSAPVPQRSISDELRHYPGDLLASPLDVRAVTLRVLPGAGASGSAGFLVPAAGLADRLLGHLTERFNRLVGARHLTLGVGLLALLLSLVLGASHAALPGHGKTVMAAYLAGKRGGTRDAVTVGVTVTFTHTAGVLVLGLLLSLSASLAGESILNWLGAASGALIAAIGIGLLHSAWRARRPGHQAHEHEHGHDHGHHGHHHSHSAHGHGHSHAPQSAFNRRGLIGMGIAGGLVPSPSALVVLLGAIALGRTVFGVALVLGYGLGMAATLTAAGVVLVRLRDRARPTLLAGLGSARLLAYTPLVTALLVFALGAALAIRSLTPLL